MAVLRPASVCFASALVLLISGMSAFADSTPQPLTYQQAWTTNLITAADDWGPVPGVVGYLGDIDAASPTGVDPQTLIADYTTVTPPFSAVDVIPSAATSSISGGVGEFDGLADPVVGMQGSGTADAPHLLLFMNTTNRASIRVRYNVRDIDGTTDNSAQQVALQYRVGNSGNFTNLPAGYIADATTGPSLATLVTPVDVTLPADANNVPLVVLRIITANAVGSDEWVGIDDIDVSGTLACPTPCVNISDASMAEGSSGGTSTLVFNITLSAPAPFGGTRFDVNSSNGTATLANNDYVQLSVNDMLMPEGQTSALVTVVVNHDTVGEPNETVNVTLSDFVGGSPGDVDGVGTIINDDPVEIHDIQGTGATSPLVGNPAITNANIVTALAPNGFFMQTPTAREDGNLATSQGIFVFTATAPTVVVGDSVNVSGTVQEFFEFTQLSGTLTITVNSSGNPLPPPVALNASFPSPLLSTPSCFADPNPELANFECIEDMRANLTDAIVSGPNQRFGTDPLAEPVIVAGPSRGFREPGIPTPGFAGIAATIPIWDRNPEVFEIDPDKLLLPNRAMTGGTHFNADGVIGYDFGDYEFWPTAITVTQNVSLPTPVAAPVPNNLTIGSLNMFRFFDDNLANNVNGALNCNGVPTCSSTSTCSEFADPGDYQRRLAKFSTYIRTVFRSPDVVAVMEVESLAVLQALADKIALDDPSVVYTAHLMEGNDVGGIDSGFLVRTGRINAGFTVTQLNKSELFNGDSPPTCLHDRPPLRLDGVFSVGNKAFSVIANHTRSLSGIGDCRLVGPDRLCAKRLAQASSIAALVQQFQTANPTTPLVVVGDHNAFQFTDGHVDVMGIIRGTATLSGSPTPDSQVAPVADIVDPNLTDGLGDVPVQQRYSYFFDNALQVLDHAVMTAAAQAEFQGMSYGRANVDAPIIFQRSGDSGIYGDDVFSSGLETGNESNPLRVSDHDGFVIRFFQ